MTLNDYRIEKGLTFEQLAKNLGFKGKNPATLAVRICLSGNPRYWKLPNAEMMIKIQDDITKGQVKIEEMVRSFLRKKKEYEQSK